MCITRETLVDLHHPEFRKGYYHGRQYYFREEVVLTDKRLVELLQCIFEQSELDEAPEREIGIYYSIGQLVGQMSARVLPCQPDEDRTQELQETFLVRVEQGCRMTGRTLVDMIRHLWVTQDLLAKALDAETFETMQRRGAELGS